jgi:hypothetical protein
MALEDACVLSAAIARHANDLDEALLVYGTDAACAGSCAGIA